ncbi:MULTISPECIES: NifX-associated nitrogen fixation protein [Microvirga]|uniref:NifX-associated nitrogen fixation protein n=1 Tax=Microvirga TaxID=186650 RepID=UPI000E0D83DE|nr:MULTISPECIES: NifX-associated nitrogen fixation protein [Microvirga]MBQ0820667.1 NifX-associated nitrogen fixation protein [Microvirga sp. HBU67558]
MSASAASTAVNKDGTALTTLFVKCLVRIIRAQDSYGSWDRKLDAELLANFIVTKDQRRAIPIIGNPNPDVRRRIAIFYSAVGLAIRERSGLMASPMIEISDEGFGCVHLTVGRLVVVSKIIRDAHRFGFETLWRLATAGSILVDDAIAAIEAYPEVARA